MKKLIRKIINFLERFAEPLPPEKENKKDGGIDELLKVLDAFEERNKGMNADQIYRMKLDASAVAREAHERQNKQIDTYFNKVLKSTMDPFLLEMYTSDRTPIPGLNTNIHFFMSGDQKEFGRRMVMFLGQNKIGDAIFTARFEGDQVFLDVTEKIKVEGPATPKSAGPDGASHP